MVKAVRYRNFESVLPWLLVGLSAPVTGGTMSAREILLGAVALGSAWALGRAVLDRVPSFREMPPVTGAGVALLLGLLLFYLVAHLVVVTGGSPLFVVGVTLLLAGVLWRLPLERSPGTRRLRAADLVPISLAFGVSLLLSIGNADLARALIRLPAALNT